MNITGIKAGLLEAQGEGQFEQKGKRINFVGNDGRLVATWWASTSAQAAQQIRLFRAAPKHMLAA